MRGWEGAAPPHRSPPPGTSPPAQPRQGLPMVAPGSGATAPLPGVGRQMEQNPVGVPQLASAGMRSYVVGKPLWGLFPYCGTPPVGAVAPTGGYNREPLTGF